MWCIKGSIHHILSNQNVCFLATFKCSITTLYDKNIKAICNMALICHISGSLFGEFSFISSWMNWVMSLGFQGANDNISAATNGNWGVTYDRNHWHLSGILYLWHMMIIIWQIIQPVVNLGACVIKHPKWWNFMLWITFSIDIQVLCVYNA